MTSGAPKGILERACLGIIAFAALFVPWPRRSDWREEWESEVWHSLHPNRSGNGPKALSGAALLLRCSGALWHALRVEFKGRGEMGEIWRDFRMGFRVLVRSPMVTLAAVVTLALGIGGTTAVFSVADGVLFNPMNFPESNRLVRVSGSFSYDNLRDLQNESRTLESIGFYRGLSVAVTGLGEPERIRGEYVSASYFDVLRVQPALGRVIRPDESVAGGELTTVLEHGYWERRF